MKLKITEKIQINVLLTWLLIYFGMSSVFGQYKDCKDRKVPCRMYETAFTETKPLIDGKGDDEVWNKVDWTSDFTQSIPKDGGQPSQKTSFKVLYDKDNLYFLVRAFDTEPDKIISQVVRHDNIGLQRRHNCDDIEIFLGTDGDVSTIINFTLMVSGSRSDYFIRNYGRSWDVTYNPIWEGKTSVDSLGWIGEARIPVNQLNFTKSDSAYTWGLLVRRTIFRLQEEDLWQWIPANSPGWAHLVGELHGIKDFNKTRHFELLPYTGGKSIISQNDPYDPFSKTFKNTFYLGLDGKYSLSSNMNLDFTINPDFGQVESDPAIVNLTGFENFYEEKRPFFIEGKDIFDLNFGNNILFYSRRIGHKPMPNVTLEDHYDVPENSTILNALKITGKTKNGLSIGILQSTTSEETAEFESYGFKRTITVEPMYNYSVIRVRKDYKQGQTKIGGFVSSTNAINNPEYLRIKRNDNGFVGGFDFLHKWKDKIYFIEMNGVFSHLTGFSDGITIIKQNPVHRYQRPDVNLGIMDTSHYLSGHGGRFAIGKLGTWQFNESFEWNSPGLDLNDIGFQPMADYLKQSTMLKFESFKKVSIFRDLFVTLNQDNTWDYEGTYLLSTIDLSTIGRFMNNFQFNLFFRRNMGELNTRQLRGGPALLNEGFWRTDVTLSTDTRKKIIPSIYHRYDWSDDKISKLWKIRPGLEVKVSSKFNIKTELGYTYDINDMQYAANAIGDLMEGEYIVAHMKNNIWESTVRINYTLTPDISLQYYANWLTSKAAFTNHRLVVNPRAKNYNDRTISISSLGGTYDKDLDGYSYYDPNGYSIYDPTTRGRSFSYPNPDFHAEEFRSNLIFRWEYLTGSTFFIIWSQNYSLGNTNGRYDTYIDYSKDFKNILLLKFTYLINH